MLKLWTALFSGDKVLGPFVLKVNIFCKCKAIVIWNVMIIEELLWGAIDVAKCVSVSPLLRRSRFSNQ